MKTQLIRNHTLLFEDKMYKWTGSTFHVYVRNKLSQAYEHYETTENPILRRIGCHNIHLYIDKKLGFRIFVASQYAGKYDYVEYPIMYSDETVAWDRPLMVPGSVKKRTISVMRKLKKAGVL